MPTKNIMAALFIAVACLTLTKKRVAERLNATKGTIEADLVEADDLDIGDAINTALDDRDIEKLKVLAPLVFRQDIDSLPLENKLQRTVNLYLNLFGGAEQDVRNKTNLYTRNSGDLETQYRHLVSLLILSTPEEPEGEYLLPWFTGQILRHHEGCKLVNKVDITPNQTHATTLRLQ